VGTGLNYKYLPRDVKLFGLDLSEEMLTACQANLRRWEMDADLFLGTPRTCHLPMTVLMLSFTWEASTSLMTEQKRSGK